MLGTILGARERSSNKFKVLPHSTYLIVEQSEQNKSTVSDTDSAMKKPMQDKYSEKASGREQKTAREGEGKRKEYLTFNNSIVRESLCEDVLFGLRSK